MSRVTVPCPPLLATGVRGPTAPEAELGVRAGRHMAVKVAAMPTRMRTRSLGIFAAPSPRLWRLLAATLILVGLLDLARSAAADPAQPLVLERKIPLGEVRGRIDHLAIDLARERLFVAELGNDSLGVVDLAAGKLLRRIGDLAEPQGVAYDSATDTVYVADGGDGLVHRFKGPELTPLETIQLGGDADNVRLDPEAGRVVVGYGDGALALIDAASGKPMTEIRLPGHPESFQLERGGPRIFANVPDAHQITVVDRSTGKQVASWGLADAQANFPMALDEADGRLVVGYREPALLAVFDTASGAPVARLSACGDTDDVFVDARRQRVYLSCGAGFLEVVQQRDDTYEELARIPTIPGARTALFVPERDRLYLAVRASGDESAAVWVFRPAS
jgi:DNA-binding beta-propeller fold protein YncE